VPVLLVRTWGHGRRGRSGRRVLDVFLVELSDLLVSGNVNRGRHARLVANAVIRPRLSVGVDVG